MIVQRKNNELIVRISTNMAPLKIQNILDYLRYEELTSKSAASEEDVNNLVNEVKKGRWGRIKKELNLK